VACVALGLGDLLAAVLAVETAAVVPITRSEYGGHFAGVSC